MAAVCFVLAVAGYPNYDNHWNYAIMNALISLVIVGVVAAVINAEGGRLETKLKMKKMMIVMVMMIIMMMMMKMVAMMMI